ncbi:uncharacterized protein LTR77_004822 [Saxophila tyrrhenica]|uniref:Zn(2)-C6 fungal-type domain-containing protein n=1 Tax=Saxophila tyrrhenica TaxID=1690608 RepID=A0AAV9PB41_9PEZI|nr:hypothetical protein LTR77_004822 [Saxophila tyrrhenica]
MFSILDTAAETVGRPKTTTDRACDQCKSRKVRCDMKRPCLVCANKGFDCTYDKARKKRGPAGKRIDEIRRAQSKSVDHERAGSFGGERRDEVSNWPNGLSMQQPQTPDLEQPLPRINTSTTAYSNISGPPLDPALGSPSMSEFVFPSLPMDSPSSSWDPFGALLQQELPPLTTSVDVWPSHINEETLLPWIDVYFKRLHPTIPILDRAEMYREMLTRKHHSEPQYGAMLLALCAFAMTQPIQIHERASHPSRSVQARMLMEECVKMRVAADFGEQPSIEMILASFFLFACLFGNGQHKAARLRLREAVDLAHSLGIHLPQSYESLQADARERWLRTYLVLSVTERAYALQQRHSIDFRGRPGLSARFMADFNPTDASTYLSRLIYSDQSDTKAMTGLLYLMESFDAIDENVIECWIGYCRYSDGVCETFDRRRALQTFRAQRRIREACLTGNISFAPSISPLPLSELMDSQRADITITQFWLLNRLWSICWSHGLLRDESDHPELQYDFACYVAHAVLATCDALPLESMEAHGVGFAEKIYDVATGIVTATQASSGNLTLNTPLRPTDQVAITIDPEQAGQVTPQDLLFRLQGLLQSFRGGDHPFNGKFADALTGNAYHGG